MNFKIQASPHIRTPNANVEKMMITVLIALIPVVFMSILQFRLEFVVALLLSIITVCGVEFISNKIMKKEQTLYDYSALVTAVIFALTIPAGIFSAEMHGTILKGYVTGGFLIVASGTFAILVGKLFFGGLGRNIFNPAGLGRIFMLVSFGAILSYFSNDTQYMSTATPLGLMKGSMDAGEFSSIMNVVDSYSISDMFIGREAGSFGEVSAIAIIISAIFLIVYKAADWRKIVACLSTFALLATIYALRLNLPMEFVIVQLLTGSILFGAVFMVTDPVTAPITALGRVFYAMSIGGLTFVIRVFGAYPEGMLFAILIMNMFTHSIDYHRWLSTRFNKQWIITLLVTLAVFIAIVLIGTK
ncbi:MAG: RnfABCDGE type electron transport complex subunit D [Bacilli bacterium]